MDLAQIGNAWLATLGRLACLAAVLGILTWLMPCNPRMFWWTRLRAALTDLVYWFVVPLFTRLATIALLVLGTGWLYGGQAPSLLPIKHLPAWAQCLLVLVLQDILLYGLHRAFHGRLAWRFHAVHHSPVVLDWASTARFHPVNQVVSFSVADAAVVLLGFSQETLAGLAVFNVAYSAFVHANLDWTFGPFKYVLASPVFHRWHHTTEEEGLDKNFASTFPVLDLIFGTFYMPEGKLPERFGSGDPNMPESFLGQLFYPFRSSSPRPFVAIGARASLGLLCLALTGLGGLIALAAQHGPEAGQTAQGEMPAEAGEPLDMMAGAPVLATAMNADGRFIASSGMDGSVRRWEPAARRMTEFLPHVRSAKAVAISADGGRLVSGGYDGEVRLLDAETRQPLGSRKQGSGVLGVAISADGMIVASCGANGAVLVWKAGDSATLRIRAGMPVPGVALAPDGRHVAGACVDGKVRVWDACTGRQLHALQGPASLAFCVALSDGARRIVAGGQDGAIHLWDGKTGQKLCSTQAHAGGVLGVAITPDGSRLVSGGADNVVRVRDGFTGREESALTGHKAQVPGVAISADGRWAASASLDSTLKAWRLPQKAPSSAGGEEAAER